MIFAPAIRVQCDLRVSFFFRRLRIEYSSDGYIFFLSLMMYDYPARLLICLNTVRERGVR